MIHATMYWNTMTLEVGGHAGYAEPGKDIVCAGASMLTDTLGFVLREAEARGRVTVSWKETDKGIKIQADPSMGALNEIKAYFRMCAMGLRLLSKNYPENVGIKEVQ